jgi:hypothetical protein
MSNALTYWMHENEAGNLEFSSSAPSDGRLYIAVTPDFLRRMPIAVCEAPTGSDTNNNTYYVKGDISSIYTSGTDTALTIMAFIASHNSTDIPKGVTAKSAQICFLPSKETYCFKTISTAGFERDIGAGDIIANKVCFIRYNPITESILLINPSIDEEAAISTLKVFKEAYFDSTPQVKKMTYRDDKGNIHDVYEEVATKSDLENIESRLHKLEQRFIIGIGNPQDALEGAEEGTIFLRLGDILT